MELSSASARFSRLWRLAWRPLILAILLVLVSPSHAYDQVPASMFVFGASMVDSGTKSYLMPYRSLSDYDPYGSDYFGKPVGRWSNGRTFMDIITQSLGLGFLDPFVKSIGANFTHGVNFASAGSTAQNSTKGLFSLLVQVDQFQEYQIQNLLLAEQRGARTRVMSTTSQRLSFSTSIFFIESGNNDYLAAGLDSDHVEVVELVIFAMKRALERLYELGGRTFIVMNLTPLGCSPPVLSSTPPNSSRDEYNCSAAWNDFLSLHNQHLIDLLDELRSKYASADWILFDAYSLFLDAYRNPSNYGITHPFQACCGAGGGLYNFKHGSACGEQGEYINGTYTAATKCDDPSLYLIWDTIHPTESFCQYIAEGVLLGTHLIPTFNITQKIRNVHMRANYL